MNGPEKFKKSDIFLTLEFKLMTTIVLSLLAFTGYAKHPDAVHTLAFVAMLFSSLGDLLLMDYLGIPRYYFKGKHFYAGMAAFAISHMFYRQAFRSALPEKTIWGIGELISFGVLILAVVGIYVFKLKKDSAVFNYATGFYSGIICISLAASINCAIVLGGKYILVMLGVICFIVSDVFILIRETRCDKPIIRKLVWVFYPIAQLLILANV